MYPLVKLKKLKFAMQDSIRRGVTTYRVKLSQEGRRVTVDVPIGRVVKVAADFAESYLVRWLVTESV